MANQSMALNEAPYDVSPKLFKVGHIFDALSLVGLLTLLIVMLFPLIVLTVNVFKTESEYYEHGPFSLPNSLNWDALIQTWNTTEYATKLGNSLIISLSTAVLALLLSLFNAFALGIGRLRGRSALLVLFLFAITLPNESLAYPLYYFFKQIGLYDTQLSVILVSAALHSAYGTYLLASVFRSFPKEILEAAFIDGCNKLQLLFKIIVPISRASITLLLVFFFIWTWNDFFLPLILLISNATQTVPLAIAAAQSQHNAVVTSQSAAGLLGIIPCIIFFFLFQRTLTRGVTAGSIK